jgi:hypothetical protein
MINFLFHTKLMPPKYSPQVYMKKINISTKTEEATILKKAQISSRPQ